MTKGVLAHVASRCQQGVSSFSFPPPKRFSNQNLRPYMTLLQLNSRSSRHHGFAGQVKLRLEWGDHSRDRIVDFDLQGRATRNNEPEY